MNDWGVYKENTNPVEWVKETSPALVLSSEDQAELMSEVDANTLADSLSQSGEGSFAPGRPKRKPPVH